MVSVKNVDNEELVFTTVDGKRYKLYYDDWGADVTIESIVGDLEDLVGAPILLAEESHSYDNPEDVANKVRNHDDDGDDDEDISFTWTFYKFATRKGYVDVRWYGSSNGYYSESVDFTELLEDADEE
jgi:hypothetical protein